MKKAIPVTIVLGVALGAGSCALVEKVRFYGAEATGRAVALECSLSVEERRKNLTAINGWLLANNVTARAVALDCDGDGRSDFDPA